jgi:diaphanous 1
MSPVYDLYVAHLTLNQLSEMSDTLSAKDKEVVYLKRALESVYSRFQTRQEERVSDMDAQLIARRTVDNLAKRDNELTALKTEVSNLRQLLDAKSTSMSEMEFKSRNAPPPPPPQGFKSKAIPAQTPDETDASTTSKVTGVPSPPPPPPPPPLSPRAVPGPKETPIMESKDTSQTAFHSPPPPLPPPPPPPPFSSSGSALSPPPPPPPSPPPPQGFKPKVIPAQTPEETDASIISKATGIPPPPPSPPPPPPPPLSPWAVPGPKKTLTMELKDTSQAAFPSPPSPPPPPPPLPSFSSSGSALSPHPPSGSAIRIRNKAKAAGPRLKPFFWTKINNQNCSATVWTESSIPLDFKLDDLEATFTIDDTTTPSSKAANPTRKQSVTTLLDITRANNIGWFIVTVIRQLTNCVP